MGRAQRRYCPFFLNSPCPVAVMGRSGGQAGDLGGKSKKKRLMSVVDLHILGAKGADSPLGTWRDAVRPVSSSGEGCNEGIQAKSQAIQEIWPRY